MSKQIPRETIDVMRQFVNVSLDNYGIDCDLYVPSNTATVETYDAYTEPEDWEYTHYECKVYIDWSQNVHRLRALGIYVEDTIPFLAYFPNKCTNDDDEEVDTDILKGSYIRVPIEYVPDSTEKVEEFDLIDIVVRGMHDAVIAKCWTIVPRRKKEEGS